MTPTCTKAPRLINFLEYIGQIVEYYADKNIQNFMYEDCEPLANGNAKLPYKPDLTSAYITDEMMETRDHVRDIQSDVSAIQTGGEIRKDAAWLQITVHCHLSNIATKILPRRFSVHVGKINA